MPGASMPLTVGFKGGITPSTGSTIQITVKNGADNNTLASKQITVKVLAQPNAPVVSTSPHRGDAIDVSQCVADCFETTFSYSTPPYISLDQPRSVTLLYRSGRARPYGRLQLGAIDGNASTTSFRLQLTDANGVNVTFSNGATSLFFAKKTADTTRIAAEFNASAIPTSGRLYTAAVTSFAGATALGTTYRAVRIIVLNDQASPYGAGVDVVGLQRILSNQSDGVLVTDGTGSASFFSGSCGPLSVCSFGSPPGDFSVLKTTGSGYRRAYPDSTIVTFNSLGQETSIKDRFGTTTQISYTWSNENSAYMPTTITDPTGQVITMYFRTTADAGSTYKPGSLGYIQSQGARIAYFGVLAPNGNLEHLVDFDGQWFGTAGYDTQHRITQMTNKLGGTTNYAYLYGKTLKNVDVPAVTINGLPGIQPRILYREAYSGLYSAADSGRGSTYSSAIAVPTFDIRAAINDPLGYGTYYTLNRFGSPTVVYAPLTNPAYATYDTLTGQLKRTVSPTGDVTKYTWVAEKLTQTFDSTAGKTINVGYETAYALPQHVYGSVVDQYFTYDKTKTGWPLKELRLGSSTAQPTTYVTDVFGRPTSVTDPQFHTTLYGYQTTGLRNSVSVTAPNGQATTFGRDSWGRVVSTTDPYTHTSTTALDVLNRPGWVAAPNGDTTKYQYDALNRVTVVTDAKGQTFTTQWNALGWAVAQLDPLGHADSTFYDSAGNVVSMRSRQGRQVKLTYDALGRVTKQIGVGSQDTVTFAYDPSSRWVYAKHVTGTTLISADTIVTDSIGRTVRESIDRGSLGRWRVSSVYNAADPGRSSMSLTKQSASPPTTENAVTYSYDANKRLSGISVPYGSTTFGFDNDNLPTTVTFPFGMTETRSYTKNHAPRKLTYSLSAVDSALGRWYATDSLARLVQRGGGIGQRFEDYGYDVKGQLNYIAKKHYAAIPSCVNDDKYGYRCSDTTAVTDSLFSPTYDKVGNPNDAGASVDGADRLRTFRGDTMTYDLDGNMLTRYGNGISDSYTWNDFGQLVSVTRVGRAQPTTFRYDGFGRRIQKVSLNGTVNYLWDGQQITAEVDQNGATLQTYSYNPGVDQPRTVTAAGQVYFMSNDPGGDVNGLLHQTTYAVSAQYTYSPWGELTTDQQMIGTTRVNSFRWRGLAYDVETGLYQVRARYYDPVTRRFISEDPIGLAGGINPFSYASNDPINRSDPTGLDDCYGYRQKTTYVDSKVTFYGDWGPIACGLDPWGTSGFGGIFDSPWGDPTDHTVLIPPGSVMKTVEKLARAAGAEDVVGYVKSNWEAAKNEIVDPNRQCDAGYTIGTFTKFSILGTGVSFFGDAVSRYRAVRAGAQGVRFWGTGSMTSLAEGLGAGAKSAARGFAYGVIASVVVGLGNEIAACVEQR
jgi:RHS repeat-associated protein